MKLTIILTSKDPETNWNAFRLANLALGKGDEVQIFLLGEGVEYDAIHQEQFDIQKQVASFQKSQTAKILACSTCMKIRNKDNSPTCPSGGIEDLYFLVRNSDKVLTF
ncbi:hypothetical protein A2767_06235 [Candidatus Roizmanbacteria bacterium RIFCSPHIGHO2_01_FULL_35_10]|uniref:Uncharacterized protein n=1 Tax=Candidatus Roizmanbacteria bacterium RIFCSPLOWO2_01_FULL_35_13 TaxID=1802055 RepID=A0A1F7I6L6_9BACT|nr:MAG: hypothetical protein A2767_06235 [Candidatus Roizmanbacteria bacterium RIFCSPHIGHO2_01_FULL_35_10]OGK39008.1 MAG: hypothetical protein A3A74_06770 [Candidatus Roizmanbacteria bacterium RIFCSPLOWO2_01_FULL_35_13]